MSGEYQEQIFIIKKTKIKSGVEKYSNQSEKFTRRTQQ